MSRRDRDKRPGHPPLYQWRVAGTDYNDNPYDRDEATCGEAHRTAARLNAKGGRVFVTRQRWCAPAAAYRDAPEGARCRRSCSRPPSPAAGPGGSS